MSALYQTRREEKAEKRKLKITFCLSKKPLSEGIAKSKAFSHSTAEIEVFAYKCQFCEFWHLGAQSRPF